MSKLHRRRRYPLCVGSFVARPGLIRNLPPFCEIVPDDQNPPYVEHFIRVDTGAVEQAMYERDLPVLDYVDNDYRGLCLAINDHGNMSLLMRFKNGNTKEIWSVV